MCKTTIITRIIQHGVLCNKCGDIMYSNSRHHFVVCKCGKTAIDGGGVYLKITGDNTTPISRITYLIRQTQRLKTIINNNTVEILTIQTSKDGTAFNIKYKFPYSGLEETITMEYPIGHKDISAAIMENHTTQQLPL